MRRVLLLRHAKTEHDAPSGQDQDRRLDDRGRLDAAAIGGWIVRQAMQDAARADAAPPKVESLDELYAADPAQILQIIRMAETTSLRQLMVIGHNPGMHELALALAGSGDAAAKKALEDNLPTTGLAVLDFAIEDWNEVAFRRGTLVRFTSPKLLKQNSDD